MKRLWYVAYGSNLSRERFDCYLRGGRPAQARRNYPGCRDPQSSQADVPVLIPGGLRFVGESSVWGGGLAVYDSAAEGEVAARAYLISAEQFVDVLAQETRREPGLDIDLTPVRETGWHSFGPGHYQTLANVGVRDEMPMLTFTSARATELIENAPSPAYLRTIARGLNESHGWSTARISRYLARFPGAAGNWTAESIAAAAA